MIFRNSTGAVTGYGGCGYEELAWLSLRLNFRYTPHNFFLNKFRGKIEIFRNKS